MKNLRLLLSLFCVLSPWLLAACDDDGWEMVMVRGQVPYTEDRTAGPGVAYVRRHMLPPKTVILPEASTPPVFKADTLFMNKTFKK